MNMKLPVIMCPLCVKKSTIIHNRTIANKNQAKNAEKMKELSNKNLLPVAVGSTVRIEVPDVDRAKTDDRSILALVTSINKDNYYELASKHGKLNHLYAR